MTVQSNQRPAPRSPTVPARLRDGRLLAPLAVLAIVCLAFALDAIWVRSIHTFTIMPDELGYVKQSLQIARTGLPVLPGDFYFNSWSELLPALSAPIFGSLGIVDAFYTAHTLYALLLASTAIPAYLLARELALGRLAGVLAAALAVGVPWLALAGVVMTEDVAYPVFVWTILAVVRDVHAPSARRDLLALVAVALAFFARTQFIVLGPILIACVLVHELGGALAGRGSDSVGLAVRRGMRRAATRHRVLWPVSLLVLVLLVVMALTGHASSVLGQYLTPVHGKLLPAGTLGAGLGQLDGVALAIGAVPLTLSVVWAGASIARPGSGARHAYALVLLLVVPVLIVILGAFQQKILGGATTDRYMFYLAPLLEVGTLAWVVERRGSWLGLLIAAVAVGALVIATGLHPAPSYSITNASFNFQRVLSGLGARVASLGLPYVDPTTVIVAAISLFVLLAELARRRLRGGVAVLVIVLPLLAYSVTDATYALTKLATENAGVPASHPRELDWIDRSVPSGSRVALLLASSGDELNTDYLWWEPNFWNDTVVRDFELPGGTAHAQGFLALAHFAFGNGTLGELQGVGYLAKLTTDARFGLRAPVVTRSGGLTLYRLPGGRTPLEWASGGFDDASASLSSAHLFVVLYGTGTRGRERVTFTLQAILPQRGCPCRLAIGAAAPAVRVPVASTTRSPTFRVSETVTVPRAGGVRLPLRVTGSGAGSANSGFVLLGVRQAPGA